MPIHLKKYFDRIHYKGSTNVSVETLKGIHLAHVFSIPFENLAIHEPHNINNPADFISLDEDAIFKKLVTDKRGGYCHENNELLALVLTELGFKVDRLAARVLTAPNLPISHKFLMVTIDEKPWLADVGFGGYGLFEPIPLIVDQEFNQYDDRYKLIRENEKTILQIYLKQSWKNLYEFTGESLRPVDFAPMNYYVSHHPDSIFVKNRISVLPMPEGRLILMNDNLKLVNHGEEKNIPWQESGAYHEMLAERFGISFPEKLLSKDKNSIAAVPENAGTRNTTNSWCHLFSKAVVGIGLASTTYIANQIYHNSR